MREVLLSIDEQKKLEEYRICFKEEATSELTIEVNDMLDRQKLVTYLEEIKQELQAPDLMVAASAFSKRYSYIIIAPAIYSFLMLNKQLEMDVSNLTILPSVSNEKWLPRLYLKKQKARIPDTEEERESCRNQLFKTIFQHHLSSLWNEVSHLCKIPKQILWENTSIYTFWIFESLLQQTDLSPEIRDKIQIDFDFLLYETQNLIFENNTTNPIAAYYGEKTNLDGKAVRIRKTCCFYYAISKEGAVCKGCPRRSLSECLQS
ncbi:hypothetical protein BTR23_09765 [Alkalihalophilus pseudofirmus]|uniref:IucA/IucC family C-terminal-domain containing protein n=1 Tax=Alkalihalobacterium alkalinitrilicum TaxID=427920 RepID=UPI00094BF9C2|nr:IucA/IucC family C-terminal-domain containing protein [Alkalihalobacterium alkalinitrilicum]OLO39322.1 hypothetical protein BTR23_09765 [Alkalihalophilus pseudofirmus]